MGMEWKAKEWKGILDRIVLGWKLMGMKNGMALYTSREEILEQRFESGVSCFACLWLWWGWMRFSE